VTSEEKITAIGSRRTPRTIQITFFLHMGILPFSLFVLALVVVVVAPSPYLVAPPLLISFLRSAQPSHFQKKRPLTPTHTRVLHTFQSTLASVSFFFAVASAAASFLFSFNPRSLALRTVLHRASVRARAVSIFCTLNCPFPTKSHYSTTQNSNKQQRCVNDSTKPTTLACESEKQTAAGR
jgi:hypothetical protein